MIDTIVGIRDAVARGEVSAVEVARGALSRIQAHDGRVRSFLALDAEGALAQATAIDRARARGEALGPLAGVPIAAKDNLCTRGVATTCASKILEGYVPPYDAHVIEKLRDAGAIIVGKANMDEFAMGSSTENSAFQKTANPWDLTRVPGGSSGGSAACVAAGFVAGSLGSDTGGSVRQPGALCGIPAIKPTYGRVSRYGLVAFASSLDQIGPMARTVRDTARLLRVIAGHDPRDATSADREVPDYEAACDGDVRKLRVGVVKQSVSGGDAEVDASVAKAIGTLRDLGCEVVDVELPHAELGLSVYYLVASAEASSNLARFDGMRYGLRVRGEDLLHTYGATRAAGFGPEVKRRIMLGTYALAAGYYDAFYLRAQKVRTLIKRDYEQAFTKCDVIVTPTSPTPAFKLGEKSDDPIAMYLADIYTLPPPLAGVPAMSVPCGFSSGGLPIGLQITAPHFEEARMIRVAAAFERAVAITKRPVL